MSAQVTISKKPLLPVIKIQKNDGSFYTFNKFTGTYDFRLRKARIVPSSDGLGGYFQLTIAHPTPASLVSIASNLEEGNEVKIWIGKTDVSGSTDPRFLGMIEKRSFVQPFKSWTDLVITGVDWGTGLLSNRIVNGYYEQRKLGDGVTADTNDTSTNIKNIIMDFLTNRDKYLLAGTSIQDNGLVVDTANIADSGRSLENFKMDAQPAEDILRLLNDEDGMIHYVDGAKRFVRKFPTATPSGILLVDNPKDSIALGWDQTKVGLIIPDTEYEVNSEERVGVLLGLGGDQTSIDQKQENIGASTDTITNYLAMKLRPKYRDYIKFQIAVGKVGTPPTDLTVELVEDDGSGNPLGSVIRKLTIPKAEISTTSDIAIDPLKAWRTLVIGNDDKINTAKDHWIIVWKVGGDASNKIVWYRNSSAGASGTSKTSTDLISWSNSTDNFAFRTYYQTPTMAVMIKNGGITASDKFYRERVMKKPSITDIQELYTLLTSQKLYYFNDRQIFKARILSPDTLIDNLQNVRIRMQQTPYAFDYEDFVVSNIEWTFQNRLGTFYLDGIFTRFAP
jgi:hypothetical protein